MHFGGPDKPIAALGQLLNACIENVPAGGEIHWVTYYFGNLRLAQALLAASRRGVKVAVTIDADPRRPEVNRQVIELLGELGGAPKWGLRALRHVLPSHVHEKLYYFSHPRAALYVGSYNPSRSDNDPQALLDDIGDQDRGHNFLVEIDEEEVVSFLRNHIRAMHKLAHDPFERFKSHLNLEHHSAELAIWFFPRRRTSPHLEVLNERLQSVRLAASHFRDATMAKRLAKLAAQGAQVEVLCHDSLRRVPRKIERLLSQSGVRTARYRHTDGLPMHNKFMLLETGSEASVLFGSFNLTWTSRWLNHEVLMKSSNSELVAAFATRWRQMLAEPSIKGGDT